MSEPGLKFECDEEERTLTYSCTCHEDFEMTIPDCNVKGNLPIEGFQDVVAILNGLSYEDLIEMHDKFTD